MSNGCTGLNPATIGIQHSMDNPLVSVDHYENFPVASVLCPPKMRPAVRAIYRFARTADDLADEGTATPADRRADLLAFGADFDAALAGEAPSGRWPGLFEDLVPHIARHRLPIDAFHDLLSAFRQDVQQSRYADRAELLAYCARSANPVGRLLLALHGVATPGLLARSDDVCTALQLINFWQDVGVDASRGRVYLPATDAERHGFSPDDLVRAKLDHTATPPGLAAALGELCALSRELMLRGASVAHAVPGRAGWELRAVVHGGLRILDHLEALRHASFARRPKLGALDVPVILWRAWRMTPHRAATASAALGAVARTGDDRP
jgi:hydroxysqualene synthase